MSEELKIIGFLCNWCSYSAADGAGGQRKPHDGRVRFVRVMCTGRIDSQLVLKAFSEGADGVMILGCHPGDCHYQAGNEKAFRRVHLLKDLLTQLKIDERRLMLEWVSASESERFAQVTDEMVRRMTEIGPLHRGVEATTLQSRR